MNDQIRRAEALIRRALASKDLAERTELIALAAFWHRLGMADEDPPIRVVSDRPAPGARDKP